MERVEGEQKADVGQEDGKAWQSTHLVAHFPCSDVSMLTTFALPITDSFSQGSRAISVRVSVVVINTVTKRHLVGRKGLVSLPPSHYHSPSSKENKAETEAEATEKGC